MEISLLVKSILGLLSLLVILVFFLILTKKKKVEVQKTSARSTSIQVQKPKTDLNSLRAIIKNQITDSKTLKDTLDLVLKHHGVIHKKLGTRTHPDFDQYMDILIAICRHKNTDKNIILGFDKDLERLNPSYKKDISDAIAKGLNSRGI